MKKKSQKTVKIKSRYVVETDTTSWCLLKKPTYRQHFRGRRSFNYAKRFSVFNQEIWKWNPHSNRPLWALRPPFYLASSLHPPHEPSPQLLIGWRPKNLSLKSMKKLCDLVSNRIENWKKKTRFSSKVSTKTDGKKKLGFLVVWVPSGGQAQW